MSVIIIRVKNIPTILVYHLDNDILIELKKKNSLYDYPFKSEMPSKMKRTPIIAMNQKTPPLRNSHAALRKFQNSPHQDGENHAIIIGIITRIKPSKISVHLFMF